MKKLKLLNVGFGNIIPINEVVAIVSPASAPIKRLIQKAKEEKGQKHKVTGRDIGLIDLTQGRKARAVIYKGVRSRVRALKIPRYHGFRYGAW